MQFSRRVPDQHFAGRGKLCVSNGWRLRRQRVFCPHLNPMRKRGRPSLTRFEVAHFGISGPLAPVNLPRTTPNSSSFLSASHGGEG
jgi:hypothetical protein